MSISIRAFAAAAVAALLQNPFPGGTNPDSEFHLFLDGSVAELICDQKHAITTRIYRKPAGTLRFAVDGTDARDILSLNAWQLKPISRDRLTT